MAAQAPELLALETLKFSREARGLAGGRNEAALVYQTSRPAPSQLCAQYLQSHPYRSERLAPGILWLLKEASPAQIDDTFKQCHAPQHAAVRRLDLAVVHRREVREAPLMLVPPAHRRGSARFSMPPGS